MAASTIPVKILLVDDRDENLLALEALIKESPVNEPAGETSEIHKARSAREALELLLEHEFALAFVDVQMPEIDGFELAELMREKERTRSIPIIFVTAGAINAGYTFKGYESGAVDFLYKPLDPRIVRSKVRVFRELEKQRLVIRSQLQELERALRMKEEFLSVASHELKTPLTAMRLQFQTLLRAISRHPGEALPQERIQRMLGTANHQVDRLNRLVDDMLDATRIHSGRLAMRTEPTDLTALVTDILDRFGPQLLSAGCEVSSKVEPGVRIVCDPFRAEQVLVNLISNVLKYAPGKPVAIQLWTENRWARIRVRDHGIGIPAEKLPRIFERFERARTHDGVSGLGLGLYIARQIVQGHGGDISVESTEGVGSTFDVRLQLLA